MSWFSQGSGWVKKRLTPPKAGQSNAATWGNIADESDARFNKYFDMSPEQQMQRWKAVAPTMRSRTLSASEGRPFAQEAMNMAGLGASLSAGAAAQGLGGMNAAQRSGALANIGRAQAGSISAAGTAGMNTGLGIRNQENARDFEGQQQEYLSSATMFGQNVGIQAQNALDRAGSYQDSRINAQVQKDRDIKENAAATYRALGGFVGKFAPDLGDAITSYGGGTPQQQPNGSDRSKSLSPQDMYQNPGGFSQESAGMYQNPGGMPTIESLNMMGLVAL